MCIIVYIEIYFEINLLGYQPDKCYTSLVVNSSVFHDFIIISCVV